MSSDESRDLYNSEDLTKTGTLLKQGFGRLYKPWATRVFKLYPRNAIFSYETSDGKVKGVFQLEDSPIEAILLPAGEKKDFAFRIPCKKVNSDNTISSKREE